VPKIQTPRPEIRQAFRSELPRDMQEVFDRLTDVVDHHRDDLGWYHQLGKLLHDLRSQKGGGDRWSMKRLAPALGPSDSTLTKALRFVELFPAEADLRKVKKLGLNWSSIYNSFTIPPAKRLAFLATASKRGWSSERVRFEIKRQFPTSRRGVGGRPVRAPEDRGLELNLEEFARLSRDWLNFYERVWEGGRHPVESQLLEAVERGLDEHKRRLVLNVANAAKEVGLACRAVRRSFTNLPRPN